MINSWHFELWPSNAGILDTRSEGKPLASVCKNERFVGEVTRSDEASPPVPTRESFCFRCRPGRWMERGRDGGADGGLVKAQAGAPFCWPEPSSSPVLLRHPRLPTRRPGVKGKQVHTHTHRSPATLSLQPPASFPSTSEQPICLFSAT